MTPATNSAPSVLALPWPPSANSLWRNVKGKTLKSEAYRDWLRIAKTHCYGVKRVAGPYLLTIEATRPDSRRRDLGNLLKATEDLLTQAGIIEDDSLAQSICLTWAASEPVKGGSFVATVQAVAPPETLPAFRPCTVPDTDWRDHPEAP